MKTVKGLFITVLLGVLVTMGLSGCQVEPEPDFSGVQEIAELSTIDCYYHTVATYNRDADGGIFELLKVGYKRMWFEFDCWIKVGIDVSKVDVVSKGDGTVVVKLPHAEVQGAPVLDTNSMSDPITEVGPWTEIIDEEKKIALDIAVNETLEKAKQDDALLARARERAKVVLETFVKHVGEGAGQDYRVVFEDAD